MRADGHKRLSLWDASTPLNSNPSGALLSKAVKIFSQFLKDEDGAALIEYTVLLGILLIAVIATIGLVGTWVSKQWLALDKALSP